MATGSGSSYSPAAESEYLKSLNNEARKIYCAKLELVSECHLSNCAL